MIKTDNFYIEKHRVKEQLNRYLGEVFSDKLQQEIEAIQNKSINSNSFYKILALDVDVDDSSGEIKEFELAFGEEFRYLALKWCDTGYEMKKDILVIANINKTATPIYFNYNDLWVNRNESSLVDIASLSSEELNKLFNLNKDDLVLEIYDLNIPFLNQFTNYTEKYYLQYNMMN